MQIEQSVTTATPAPAKANPVALTAIWVGFVGIIVVVIAAAVVQQYRGAAPFQDPPIYGEVPSFSLTNQTSGTTTLADFAGKTWVIDFVFTRCGGQCPFMSARMRELQKWLESAGHADVKLVSVSVDPEYDTPPVLTEYAKKFEADPNRWTFLTGEKKFIYPFIQEGFKLGVDDAPAKGESSPEEPIIHSSRFVLMDSKGRLRGYYDAYDENDRERLHHDIAFLEKNRD
ncbi:MAG: SCO family protein [Candidatus Sumerlaeaceae bacterium]|nr:SCO family protein [Candidatus Sumerlaeaceae bacterium]